MKKLPLFLCITALLLACKSKITQNDEFIIQKSIDIHNTKARYRFTIDSIDGKAESWSAPYDIKKDRFLTMDKYIEYCKAHGYDPKEYTKFLD
jgi:hypothetical protein